MLYHVYIIAVTLASIITLNDDNFQQLLTQFKKETKDTILKVYSPSCGHCTKFAPVYIETEYLNSIDPDTTVVFAEINALENPYFINVSHVDAYPSLLIFKHNDSHPILYARSMDPSSILNYMRSTSIDRKIVLNSMEELHHRIDTLSMTFLLEVGNSTIQQNALRVYKANFTIMEEGTYLIRDAFTSFPDKQILRVKSNEDINNTMAESTGYCDDLNKYQSQQIKGILIAKVDELKNAPHMRYLNNRLRMLKEAYPSIDFCLHHLDTNIPYVKNMYTRAHTTSFGIRKGSQKYKLSTDLMADGTFNMSMAKEFIGDVLKNKVEPHIRSQPLPEFNDIQDIKTLVGKNYADFLKSAKGDVIVRIYSELGDKEKIMEAWHGLSDMVKASPSIKELVLAHLDMGFNEIPEDMYPMLRRSTILYYKKGNPNPIPYEGRPDSKDMFEFAKEQFASK